MKKFFIKEVTCIVLSACLFLSVNLFNVFYKTNIYAADITVDNNAAGTFTVDNGAFISQQQFNNSAIYSGYNAPLVDTVTDTVADTAADTVADEDDRQGLAKLSRMARENVLPSAYDSREYGNVTSVKYQGNLGICWAYAAVACMESYALTHGLVETASDIDLSEYALAYMTYKDENYSDPVGGVTGDITTLADKYDGSKYSLKDAMSNGGNDNIAFKTLSKWAAITNETSDTNIINTNFVKDIDVQQSDISYILTGQYYINMNESNNVKKAIQENGAVSILYNSSESYNGNTYTESWKNLYHYTYDNTAVNHAVAIVGWDDNLDRSHFSFKDSTGTVRTPEGNGAWLIKNSWSTTYGEDGYMWISYYDSSIGDKSACVYEIASADTYKNNYQYDGSTVFAGSYSSFMVSHKYANVFTVAGKESSKEVLRAVSFATRDANRNYSIQIYKNPDEDKPETGTPLLTTPLTGSTTYAGYYTVPLDEAQILDKGNTFAVVISFDERTIIEQSINKQFVGACSDAVNVLEDNQSYFYDEVWNTNEFFDTYSSGTRGMCINFCIKAFTNHYTPITLSELNDMELTRGVQSEALTVNIDNAAAGQAYEYQWFVSETENGPATPVTGAITNRFVPNTDTNGTQYYFCRVSYCNTNYDTDIDTNRAKVVVKADVSSLNYESIEKCIYNGKPQKPEVVVKDGNITLTENTDYTLEYINNTAIGNANVSVIGIGNYKGTKSLSFVIEEAPVTIPSEITSNNASINQSMNTVSKVTVSTTVEALLSTIPERNFCIVVKNGKEVSGNSLASTGMEIRLMNGQNISRVYSVVVTGDINGDGITNIIDMMTVKRNILGMGSLSGVYLKAADVNGDGNINIVDFMRIKSYILGKSSLNGVAAH